MTCERHPDARRYPEPRYARSEGTCTECKAEYDRGLWLRRNLGALATLVNGDDDLAVTLVTRLGNHELGVVAVALRAARKGGRQHERAMGTRRRALGRNRLPAVQIGPHLRHRITAFASLDSDDTLTEIRHIREAARAAEGEAVARQRALGYSETKIARDLDITRPALAKRWPRTGATKVAPRLDGSPCPVPETADGAGALRDQQGGP